MPIDDLFDEEDAIISIATDIVATNSYSENPLFPHFSKLLLSFVKLNKQQKRIIRLSDKQHLKLSVVNREMKHILDNIPVGIAIIDKDGTVNPSYSRYMHQLFRETKKIAGAKIDHLLYWEEYRENERITLRKWLTLVFDLSYNWDLVGGLGPDVIQHETAKGPLHYRNSFHRIIHDNGDMYLMIYVTDITERIRQKNALKEQETAHNFELEIFSCVVNQENNTDIIDYINETERMLIEGSALFNILSQAEDKTPHYHHMFRLMHSIKGFSKTYGMNEFGRLAHMAEDILNKYRTNEISFETGLSDGVLASESLRNILEKMKKLLVNGESILHKIFNQGKENAASIRSRRRDLKVGEEKFQSLIALVAELKNQAPKQEHLSKKIDDVIDQMLQLTLQPIDVVYNRFHQIVKDVSQSLAKKAELVIEGDPIFLGPEAHYLVINSMIHLLRNSLDHGIEPPELRSELGKNPMGSIRIKTAVIDKRIHIEISDDGAGIDPHSIADKAVAKRFVTEEDVASMSDENKTALILIPGFSSKESVSDISGRGVGMDVVAEAMKSLGGSLSIVSEPNAGTTLTMEFPVSKKGIC